MRHVKVSILLVLVFVGLCLLAKFSDSSPTSFLFIAPIYFTTLAVLIIRQLIKIVNDK
jgi:hypothetical protein